MAYIEPCCCERQLPKLLREKDVFFQTSGDVTIKHLMKSVACMVDGRNVMWLVAPDVDVYLLHTIRHWFARGWLAGLRLITNVPRHAMVKEILEGCPDVEYAGGGKVANGLLVFCGEKTAVAVQGDMLLEKDFAMRMYAGWFGQRDGEKFKALLEPFAAKIRVAKKKA